MFQRGFFFWHFSCRQPSLCTWNLLLCSVLHLSKWWQCNPKESCCSFNSLSSPVLGPRAFICWLQFISSHYSAADLIACTFCCHLKGISCHALNWCTCLRPWTVFVPHTLRVCVCMWAVYRSDNATDQHTGERLTSASWIYIWIKCFIFADLIWLPPKERCTFWSLKPLRSLYTFFYPFCCMETGMLCLYDYLASSDFPKEVLCMPRRPSKPWPLTSFQGFSYGQIDLLKRGYDLYKDWCPSNHLIILMHLTSLSHIQDSVEALKEDNQALN